MRQSRIRDKEKLRGYSKKHYEANREKMIAKAKAARPLTIARASNAILQYLNSHPCIDCGECDPIVLEFDHRGDKKFNLGESSRKGKGVPAIMAEIEKCDVRCANCHRRKTYRERGFTHKG